MGAEMKKEEDGMELSLPASEFPERKSRLSSLA
jgi:hypothetical protein